MDDNGAMTQRSKACGVALLVTGLLGAVICATSFGIRGGQEGVAAKLCLGFGITGAVLAGPCVVMLCSVVIAGLYGCYKHKPGTPDASGTTDVPGTGLNGSNTAPVPAGVGASSTSH